MENEQGLNPPNESNLGAVMPQRTPTSPGETVISEDMCVYGDVI